MDNDDDALLLMSLDAAAKYSRSALDASNALRDAFFKLSAAKRSVATDVLSSLSFKEVFDATTGVSIVGKEFHLRKNWDQERDNNTTLQQEKRLAERTSSDATKAAALRNRKPTSFSTSVHDEAPHDRATTPSPPSTLPTPVFWFAPMPSQDLRAAQLQFSRVLEQYVHAATLARQTTDAVRAVNPIN
ncbi:hypothetical protein AaE_011033 [Aphanomyces astaci]|uniref:Vacuolar ATPase assembly protein VMA22 n=1 Tax=Aphanomyces astaci TaxID=112090 RepID=A0A6A4ZHB8_APHAT|nr:hypothetical protein AaE_011033 [Aphanomyces astaci]